MIIAFLVLVFAGPRVFTALWWLLRPGYFDLYSNSFLLPLIGIIFVPFVTLMYFIVAPGGIVGFDWVWLGLALTCDVLAYGGAGYNQMNGKKTATVA